MLWWWAGVFSTLKSQGCSIRSLDDYFYHSVRGGGIKIFYNPQAHYSEWQWPHEVEIQVERQPHRMSSFPTHAFGRNCEKREWTRSTPWTFPENLDMKSLARSHSVRPGLLDPFIWKLRPVNRCYGPRKVHIYQSTHKRLGEPMDPWVLITVYCVTQFHWTNVQIFMVKLFLFWRPLPDYWELVNLCSSVAWFGHFFSLFSAFEIFSLFLQHMVF